MKIKLTIKKDGTSITEVLDREGGDCKEVLKLTERLGQTISEEITGPDCDTAIETTVDV
jgi:hypothetical protein